MTGKELPTHILLQAIDSARDVIMITEAFPLEEPGPAIVYVNKAFEQLTGYTADEVVGRSPRILQGEKTSRETLNRIMMQLKANEEVHESVLNYTKTGDEYWLDLLIVPLYDEYKQVAYFAAIERNVTDEKELQGKLKELSHEDALTKTLARNAFFQLIDYRFKLYQLDKIPFAMLLIDIDDFKKIVTEHDKAANDEFLRWIANGIKQSIRKFDIVSRYDSEKFIVLLANTDIEGMKQVACAIKQHFMVETFTYSKEKPIKVTFNIGAAVVSDNDISAEQLLKRADVLLYQAKLEGKNGLKW